MWISRVARSSRHAALHSPFDFLRQLLEVSCSCSLHPAYQGQNAGPHGLFAGRGHNVVQKMLVTYNKVVKNKLLMKKVTDHAFERRMEVEKKMTKLRRIIDLIRKQPNATMLYIYILRRGKAAGLFKPERMTDVLAKYPGIIDLYYEPDDGLHWVRLPKYVLELLEEEKKITAELAPRAVPRLRKLLMMSSTRRIGLDCLAYLQPDLGLPDDFRERILEKHPEHFKIVEVGRKMPPLVELVSWDPALAVPAIDKERHKKALEVGLSEEEIKATAFSFPISYPPSFKVTQLFRSKMRKWQQLPYTPPYQDAGDLNLESPGSCKRAVAMLHEYLHLTVEKKSKVERLARLREDLKLPKKVGDAVLEQPGIFYFSSKGKGQTIFLRAAYRKGELIEKDPLHVLKDKFIEFMRKGSSKRLQKQVNANKQKMFDYKGGGGRSENLIMTPDKDDSDIEDEMREEGDSGSSIDECNQSDSGLEDILYDPDEYVQADDSIAKGGSS